MYYTSVSYWIHHIEVVNKTHFEWTVAFDTCTPAAVIYFWAAPFFALPALPTWDETYNTHESWLICFAQTASTIHLTRGGILQKASQSLDIAENRSFTPPRVVITVNLLQYLERSLISKMKAGWNVQLVTKYIESSQSRDTEYSDTDTEIFIVCSIVSCSFSMLHVEHLSAAVRGPVGWTHSGPWCVFPWCISYAPGYLIMRRLEQTEGWDHHNTEVTIDPLLGPPSRCQSIRLSELPHCH